MFSFRCLRCTFVFLYLFAFVSTKPHGQQCKKEAEFLLVDRKKDSVSTNTDTPCFCRDFVNVDRLFQFYYWHASKFAMAMHVAADSSPERSVIHSDTRNPSDSTALSTTTGQTIRRGFSASVPRNRCFSAGGSAGTPWGKDDSRSNRVGRVRRVHLQQHPL